VDLRERHQLDMTAAVHKVRAKVRPWRSILALLIAIAGAVAAKFWGTRTLIGFFGWAWSDHETQKIVFLAGSVAFVVFGLIAAVGLSGSARTALQPVVGQAHAGVVRYVLVLAGVFAWLAIVLALVGVPTNQLLVGGAVTGVLLGIAAQQTLANLFAGLVLLFARPFRVGDHVRFRAGALSGIIEGYVTDLSLTYVRLDTRDGKVLVPNAQALSAAVLLVDDPPSGDKTRDGAAGAAVPVPGAVTASPATTPASGWATTGGGAAGVTPPWTASP
jgi:small-conductance mechanosensitive channel